MNKLKEIREARLLSKSELARKAGLAQLTIDRIEKGFACRIDTQRKVLVALGLSVKDKGLVFDELREETKKDDVA